MKRTITVCLCLLLLLALPLHAAAKEQPAAASTAVTTAATAAITTTPSVTATPPTAGETPTEEEAPPLAAAALFLRENAAELLSGACLLFSLFVTLLLRKRVLPSLLSALSSLLNKSREALDGAAARSEEEKRELARLFAEAERLIGKASDAAALADKSGAQLAARRAEGERLSLLLDSQASLLYELLMSANLPDYQKDRIGAAYAAQRAALSEDGDE